jgi:hypothetical protein
MDREGNCRHSIIQRNCYACHLEYINSQEKTQLDTLHETICELKIRVSKLEEYKRLQDDLNKDHNNHKRKIKIHDEKLNILLVKMNNLDLAMTLAKDFDKTIAAYAENFKDFDELMKQKTTGLTFEEAIVAFKNHKSIYRNGWECSINYLDKTIHLNIDDLLATDWEIIE